MAKGKRKNRSGSCHVSAWGKNHPRKKRKCSGKKYSSCKAVKGCAWS